MKTHINSWNQIPEHWEPLIQDHIFGKIRDFENFLELKTTVVFKNCEFLDSGWFALVSDKTQLFSFDHCTFRIPNRDYSYTFEGYARLQFIGCDIDEIHLQTVTSADFDECFLKDLTINNYFDIHADRQAELSITLQNSKLVNGRIRSPHFERVILKHSSMDTISIKGVTKYFESNNVTVNEEFDFDDLRILNSTRSSFRFLKYLSFRNNDTYKGSYWKKREYDIAINDFRKQKKYIKYIQLLLNSLSNRHGTDWFRGVIFTFAIGLIGFLCFIFFADPNLELNWSLDGFIYIWNVHRKDFPQIFNPVKGIYSVELAKMSYPLLSGFIALLTKIGIIYGIYQTAQAFRRFSK